MPRQVMLAQRLGYANVFDALRPAMHYRLRMWRADDHQVCGGVAAAWTGSQRFKYARGKLFHMLHNSEAETLHKKECLQQMG